MIKLPIPISTNIIIINLADPCHNPLMDYLNPCHNGGTCSFDADFNVSCECPPEWTGEFGKLNVLYSSS